VSFSIEFSPWGRFRARKNPDNIRRWLNKVADASEEAFRGGMGQYPPASDPGAWPNNRTGRLSRSIQTRVTANTMTIGTSMPYSGFLRNGTTRMARRKMSDNALQEGMRAAGRLKYWVEWVRS
jgi:phage gpG-like protein